MNPSKSRFKFSLVILFILIAFSLVSISCNKSKDLVDTWAQGVVVDTNSLNPISDAKVYLMKR